jgi:hypothetical protein
MHPNRILESYSARKNFREQSQSLQNGTFSQSNIGATGRENRFFSFRTHSTTRLFKEWQRTSQRRHPDHPQRLAGTEEEHFTQMILTFNIRVSKTTVSLFQIIIDFAQSDRLSLQAPNRLYLRIGNLGMRFYLCGTLEIYSREVRRLHPVCTILLLVFSLPDWLFATILREKSRWIPLMMFPGNLWISWSFAISAGRNFSS